MRRHISAIAVISGAALLLLTFAAGAGASVIYVKWDSPQDGPGTNWSNAYHEIQDGIDATALEDVWVARGTYSEHITLKSDIQVYGGFVGNETGLSQRPAFPRSEPDPNASIIDGGNSGRCVVIPGDT